MQEDYERENVDIIDKILMRPKSYAVIGLVLINVWVFLMVEITGSSMDSQHMLQWGAAEPVLIQSGEFYRLFTSMFLHFGLEHLLCNMVLLFFAGDSLERAEGKLRFLLVYLGGGLIGNLASFLWDSKKGENIISAGASGAVFAIIGALIFLVLYNKGRFEAKSLKRLLLMAILTIVYGMSETNIDNAAHIGGLIGGFFIALLVCRKTPATHELF